MWGPAIWWGGGAQKISHIWCQAFFENGCLDEVPILSSSARLRGWFDDGIIFAFNKVRLERTVGDAVRLACGIDACLVLPNQGDQSHAVLLLVFPRNGQCELENVLLLSHMMCGMWGWRTWDTLYINASSFCNTDRVNLSRWASVNKKKTRRGRKDDAKKTQRGRN